MRSRDVNIPKSEVQHLLANQADVWDELTDLENESVLQFLVAIASSIRYF